MPAKDPHSFVLPANASWVDKLILDIAKDPQGSCCHSHAR